MNFARVEMYRQMRGKLHTAIKRGRLAVLDIGSSKITCLVLRLNPEKMVDGDGRDRYGASLFGALEGAGARTVQARGIRRGEIVDMNEVCRSIRQALLDLAENGTALVVISQDLDELMEISDRFAALNEGRLAPPRPAHDLTVDEIGLMMGGAHGMEVAHV